MKRSKLFGCLALVLSLLSLSPALGALTPSIKSVVVLYPSKQLDIRGADFGTLPKVAFSGTTLVSTYNPALQQILADLVTIPAPGTYLLSVTRANGSNATMFVNLGGTGPQGPPGEPASNVPVLSSMAAGFTTLQSQSDQNAATLQAKIDQSTAALRAKIDESTAILQSRIDNSVATLQATIAALQNALQATAAANALKQDHSWFLTGLTLGSISTDNGGPDVLEAAFPVAQYEYGFTQYQSSTPGPLAFTLYRYGGGSRFANSVPYIYYGGDQVIVFGWTVYHHLIDSSDTANWRADNFVDAHAPGVHHPWEFGSGENCNPVEIWARRR